MIITIARECGSNGHAVGEKLAEMYHLPLYDRSEMIRMAKELGIYERTPNFFAEKPVNSLLYAIAAGEEIAEVGKIPLQALREIVGDSSCIIIGRCGNYAFRDRSDAVRVFLHGDPEERIVKIMESRGVDHKEGKRIVEKTDKRRREFQNYYTGETWGEASHYDLCLDCSRLGVNGSVAVIQKYIEMTLR